MTDNASIVKEMVRSLSFEVVATPDQKVVSSTTTKATPLNIKVKVKKKHDGGLQHGVLATPLKSLDEVPQRIRLVSSDQTIMSFNAVMEDIDFDKSRVRNPLPNTDNQPYTSSTKESCQSPGTLKNKYLLTEDDSKKKKYIFGRCKPGGCLDPPFGEDKYSYEPSKQERTTLIQDAPEKKRTSSIFSNKLFNKIKKPKNNKVDVKKAENESNQSITSLYQTGSLHTSNSIITYPSLLNESNDKIIQDRQKSPKNSVTRKSTVSENGSLYIVPKKTRASIEKTETKRKSESNDTDLDSKKELRNIGNGRKLDDDERVDASSLKYLEEGGPKHLNADTIDEINHQENNMLPTIPKIKQFLSDNLVDNALESEQDHQENNMLPVEPKIEQCLSENLVDNALESERDHQEKYLLPTKPKTEQCLSDNLVDNALESEQDHQKINMLPAEPKIQQCLSENLVDNALESEQDHQEKNMLSTESKIEQCLSNNLVDNALKSEQDHQEKIRLPYEPKIEQCLSNKLIKNALESEHNQTTDNTTSRVKTGLIEANVTVATAGIAATLLTKLKDNYKTSDDTSVDKLSNIDTDDLKFDDNDTNKEILNDNGNNFKKTEHGSDVTDGEQLSTNTIYYNNSDVNKSEGLSSEDGKIVSNNDLSKVVRSDVTEGVMDDTNQLLNEAKNLDSYKLVSADHDSTNKMGFDNLSEIKEFDSNEDFVPDNYVSQDRNNINKISADDLSANRDIDNKLASLDTSVKIDKHVSKSDIAKETTCPEAIVFTDPLAKDYRESDSELKPLSTSHTNIGGYKDNENTSISDKISKNNEDIVSVSNEQVDLQDMLEKEKEFLELDETVKETTYPKATVFTDPLAKDVRESDFELQLLSTSETNIGGEKDNQKISIRDGINDIMSKNDENIVSVLNEQVDLQDMLAKGKDFIELAETRRNDKTQSGLKKEHAVDYENMEMTQTINIIDYDEQNNISNDVIHKNISSHKLEDIDDLNEDFSKLYKLQPRSNSDIESLKEINIKVAADGDKQKKQKESVEQLKTKIDLGLHTYTNETNELIIKSFDSKTPPSRYPRDSVIVTACDLKEPFEFKIPFGSEQYLSIQIKVNENLTKILPETALSSKNIIIHKKQKPKLYKINQEMNNTVENATKAVKLMNKNIVNAQMKDIYGKYENELLPLQKSLTRLKQDVDVLILHQKSIRNNLLTKSFRIQGNRKCGCAKKL